MIANNNGMSDSFYTNLKNKYPYLSFSNLLLVLGIAGVMPFIINSFYIHPAADDFVFANVAIEKGILGAQVEWYFSITGRYFSTLLLSLSPLVFNWMKGAAIVPISLIILLLVGLFALVKETGFHSISFKTRVIIALLILFCYLHRMPDTGKGLYWLAGAITYQAGNVFTLLYFVF